MMTGMERLAAAVTGKSSDRIPVFCNLFDQGAKELGMSLKEYYSKGEYVAEAQLAMREKYGYDNLWSLFFVGKEAELLGCKKIIFAKDGPPNVGELIIKNYVDIHKLQVPDDILSHPAFEQQKRCLQILKREAGGKYPICAFVTASMTLPAILMGMEKWMALLLMGPTEVRDALLLKCSEFVAKQIVAYRDCGVDLIVYSNPFSSTDIIPMNIFKELSLEWMQKDVRFVGTQGLIYQCGGARLNTVVDEVLNTMRFTACYLSPMDDIAQAKQIIAGRALCAGAINDIKMLDWSKEQIRNEVKRLIQAGMSGGNFLFGTMVMPYGIPEDNIKIMLEAAYEYGSS